MSNRAHKIPKSRAHQQRQQREEAAARRKKLAIAGGVIALLIVAGITALLISGDDDSEADGPDLAFNGTSLPALVAGGADPAIGLKAPIFVTENLAGDRVVTGGGGGPNDTAKVVVFVAHWCPTCQREVPRLATWLRSNDIPDGVEVVTVSTFPDATRDNHPPDAWFADVGWPLPVLVDSSAGGIAEAFGMGSVPSWVVIDDKNFVLERTAGALTDAQFENLLAIAATAG